MGILPVKTELTRVAVLGTPNVGKSTLFNRLIGERITITDSEPGVTRDPVEAVCELDGKRLLFIDTGGYKSGALDTIESLVIEKSIKIGTDSDLILLLIDINKMDQNDYMFLDRIRPLQDKVILVINKIDNAEQEYDFWNMYSLGFKNTVGISASHGRNIDELKKIILDHLRGKILSNVEMVSEMIRIAILGKPNTGKSTLLNYLLGEEKSIVTDIPGTTRDVINGRIIYKNKHFQILDTAGIRRKSKVKKSVEYYSVNRAIGCIKQSDLIFLLIDSREGLTEQDKKIASLIFEAGRGIILGLSKWDLMPKIKNQLNAVIDRIHFLFPALKFTPVLPFSGKTGFGINKLLDMSITIKDQLERRVKTSELNKYLQQWIAEYPLPVRGKNIKIRYTTQISANPVHFIFFLNKKGSLPRSYQGYLGNKIREELGFSLIPVKIDFRYNAKGEI